MSKIANLFIISILIVAVLNPVAICANADNSGIMPREQYKELARKYASEDELDKLNQLMEDMLEKYPDDPYALNHKGSILLIEGNFDEAEKIIKYAIEKNPNSKELDELYLTLGDVFHVRNNYEKAEEYFKKAIENNPDSRAHANLGYLYADQGKYRDAIKEIDLFLKNRRGSDRLHKKRGDIYYAIGEYKAAVVAYQKSIDLGSYDEHDIFKLLGLAKSCEALGDYYHANLAYEELYRWHKYTASVRNEYRRFKRKLEEIQKDKN